ncbi:hypothetical protein TNCV_576581 [Trichonephila clavipes]|nr:hypothetical protein TNCV_576581 [Trichonephila clavipes]
MISVVVVVVVSFPEGRNESCQSLGQVRLLYDRWRHQLFPPPQLGIKLEGREIFSSLPAPVISAAKAHKICGPPDLTSTHSMCTRRYLVASGIEPRPSGLKSDAITIRLPTA